MKKSLSILKEIIDLIPEYDKETNNENANIASFTLWLNDRVFESKVGHDKKMVYKILIILQITKQIKVMKF
jgi:hypothetical protein